MSDCSTRAFDAGEEPIRVMVVFAGGDRPYPLTLARLGRTVDHFEADGARYVRETPPDWDDFGLTD